MGKGVPPAGVGRVGSGVRPPAGRSRVVLHLHWDGRRLFAWAERGTSDPFRMLHARGDAPPHPGAVPGTELSAALGVSRRARAPEAWLRVPLPARAGAGVSADPSRLRPVPAPGLGAPTDVPFVLAPFLVPGVDVPADAFGPLLFAADPVPPEWRLGGDARFWRQAGRLALARCGRGSYAPVAGRAENAAPAAVWAPVADPDVEEAEERLAAAMPPACRLAVPDESPLTLVRTFTAAALDAAVRSALAGGRLGWSRVLRPDHPAMRWLLGLLHAVPLPLPPGVPRDFAAAAAGGYPGWESALRTQADAVAPPRVRLVLRLDDPVGGAPGGDGSQQDGAASGAGAGPALAKADDPAPGDKGAQGGAAAPRCPLSLWIQTFDPDGSPAAAVAMAAARAGDVSGRDPAAPRRDLAARTAASALAAAATEALRDAARIWAPLVQALYRPALDILWLTPDEALELADRAAPRLEARGVEVIVPAWWRAKPAYATAHLRVSDVQADFSRSSLAEFAWEVALGGEAMDPLAFESMVETRTPLVRLRSGWARVDPAALRRIAEAWAESGVRGRVAGFAALRLALESGGGAVLPDGEEADGAARGGPPPAGSAAGAGALAQGGITVEASGRVARWLSGLEAGRRAGPLPEPPAFEGRLRPYQRAGLGWLAFLSDMGLGGCLADDMGLGKTVQVLALLAHRRVAVPGAGPTLLVCPTSVLWNWRAEAARFVPALRLHVHHGPGRPRGLDLERAAAGADLVATTYALLARDADDLGRVSWDGVVLDEAQNVKNPAARQAQAARALPARYRFALTGTPIENGLRDLWSIFAFALPGYLGGNRTFLREYARPVGGGDEAAAARLRRAVAPFILRRTKRDPGVAPELPEKIETRQECTLGPEQAALYAAVARDALKDIDEATGLRRKAVVLTTLLRLKQICDHPSLFLGDGGPLQGRSGKLRRLEELLEDVLAEGDRALIFTQFATWARRLSAHLEERTGARAYCLTGSVPAAQRPDIVRGFQGEEGPALFVLSLKAGGAGLNLTNAQHVFHFDRWWNPAVEEQATDRAYRIGQGRVVQVHTMVVRGTLEERIDALLAGKRALARRVVGGASEAWITELSTDELRDLFRMSADAVEA